MGRSNRKQGGGGAMLGKDPRASVISGRVSEGGEGTRGKVGFCGEYRGEGSEKTWGGGERSNREEFVGEKRGR